MNNPLRFSTLPGAYERHLQRKYQNPLFPTAQQNFLPAEIEQARHRDQQDLQAFMDGFQEAVNQAATLSGSVDSEIVLDLKETLERLYVTSSALAGDLSPYQDALMKLIRVCMQTIRKGAADDVIALRKLDEEEQARTVYFAMLEAPLVAELMRGDEIIQAEELIPSVLSLEDKHFITVLELFEPEYLEQLVLHTREYLQALPEDVRVQKNVDHKLSLMEKVLSEAQ
ncbi:MAG: hypothetical protein GC149_05290 [Gammaproteobacteria bacterium]|nr:hypothetical protein [Gammaproteobacteria bacterium]